MIVLKYEFQSSRMYQKLFFQQHELRRFAHSSASPLIWGSLSDDVSHSAATLYALPAGTEHQRRTMASYRMFSFSFFLNLFHLFSICWKFFIIVRNKSVYLSSTLRLNMVADSIHHWHYAWRETLAWHEISHSNRKYRLRTYTRWCKHLVRYACTTSKYCFLHFPILYYLFRFSPGRPKLVATRSFGIRCESSRKTHMELECAWTPSTLNIPFVSTV